ncbi:MAG: nucleotide exchange factor GrpE [Nanoarchaeota archaeon]
METEINNEIQELQNKLQEYENDLKRIQAEFENFQKRTEKEKDDLLKYASHKLIIKLISIKEDFERALENNNADKEELLQGLTLIKKELDKTLDDEEVRYIEVINKKYDPFVHEVIQKIISDEEEGKIIEEIQKGYYFKDKIIRNPKVKISIGTKDEK